MPYDSRRWTGRYGPGEMPPEFAGRPRPYRSRALRWWLLIAIVLSLALAICQLALPAPHNAGLPFSWFLITGGINATVGRSPFARGTWQQDAYDEFERAALMRARDRAYFVLAGLGAAAFAWCAIARVQGWPMPVSWQEWTIWSLCMVAIASNLPVLLAEFSVPIPVEDEA